MKRSKFITSSLAIAASLLILSARRTSVTVGTDKGFKIPAGEGSIRGYIKLKGCRAAITTAVLLCLAKHLYRRQEEPRCMFIICKTKFFCVLVRNYYFQSGDEKCHLSAGDSIFMPMKVPHVWTQIGEKGRVAVLF
jgi:hypothetical protein